ncbi:MAG: hypothetical protein V3V11_11090 [Vicinamibacteria bacterium]
MGNVYVRILEKIEALGYPVLEQRVGLSLPSKLGLVVGAMISREPKWKASLSQEHVS